MFCTKCGMELPEGTKFCTRCGAPVENAQTPSVPASSTPEPAPQKGFPLYALIIPVVALLAVGAALIFAKGRSSSRQDANTSSTISESVISESSVQESSVEQAASEASSESAVAEEPSEESAEEVSEAAPAEESSVQEQAQAVMELVTTDVSSYPLVKAYIRVSEATTGASIAGLTPQDFQIQEKLSGGAYVMREVKSAEQLAGHQGLHIALVADKSDSIYESDMEKIKLVMAQFVDQLNYTTGDKAEVLAFDSIVQQMATFTNDPNLLKNGIRNMSTDGMTALYNAIYDGITHATLQGGARCVIAFTDGMDNESRYTPQDIIDYANRSQVPVYIIGVGSDVDTFTLRLMAESTGGRYWFIDDLYDLEEIYTEIYSQQMEIYAVEYVSDESADPYATRDLAVTVENAAYVSSMEFTFTPSISLQKTTHESRYELVVGAYTWEEASRLCQEKGGHLATITSAEEQETLVDLAADAELKYVWIGGYTSYDSNGNVFGHWVTGEAFSYEKWADGEPSRYDKGDGEQEWYLMLWNVPELGGWTWNDQRNDPVSYVATMADKMGYICEYEE